jgi:hypothetical protein
LGNFLAPDNISLHTLLLYRTFGRKKSGNKPENIDEKICCKTATASLHYLKSNLHLEEVCQKLWPLAPNAPKDLLLSKSRPLNAFPNGESTLLV